MPACPVCQQGDHRLVIPPPRPPDVRCLMFQRFSMAQHTAAAAALSREGNTYRCVRKMMMMTNERTNKQGQPPHHTHTNGRTQRASASGSHRARSTGTTSRLPVPDPSKRYAAPVYQSISCFRSHFAYVTRSQCPPSRGPRPYRAAS